MPPLMMMIKPASSACNMACGYCFYRDVAQRRSAGFAGMLGADRLEALVRQALDDAEGGCAFAFQGGEPTLAGLAFYQTLIELVKRHNHKGLRVNYSIQTNGYALDAEWAAFFRKHDFLVGLSLDGPAELHNQNRPDHAGKGSWGRVMNTLRLFEQHGVQFNVLAVVTGQNARHITAVYRFFAKQNLGYLQFIPCLEPLDAQRGASPWHLGVKEYERWLVTLFDLWYEDVKRGNYVSIRHLDNWGAVLLGQRPEACNMTGQCSVQFIVEGDGGVYPCDFYVTDEWRLGTVGQQTLEEMRQGEVARRFIAASLPVPERCKRCRWYFICRNGCRRDRAAAPGEAAEQNYYCEAYQGFFDARFDALRDAVRDAVRRLTGRPTVV